MKLAIYKTFNILHYILSMLLHYFGKLKSSHLLQKIMAKLQAKQSVSQ